MIENVVSAHDAPMSTCANSTTAVASALTLPPPPPKKRIPRPTPFDEMEEGVRVLGKINSLKSDLMAYSNSVYKTSRHWSWVRMVGEVWEAEIVLSAG